MSNSYLHIMLHAHLPFIRHPEDEHFLEERWLYEAISETYLPLLRMLSRLEKDAIPAPLVISFSPCLMAMLEDELLSERYVKHLQSLIELGHKELERTKKDKASARLSYMYLSNYQENLHDYEELYARKILSGFAEFGKKGIIEIISTAASYAFLPLYEMQAPVIRAQIATAVDEFELRFNYRPSGFWLPEAGYFEGLEHYLHDEGIAYFYSSFHGVMFSPSVPRAGIYAPIKLANGMHAFGRDLSSAGLVWSPKNGYPADPVYRDFYRDIGYDLDLDHIGPYIHKGQIRTATGYKYHAIRETAGSKVLYDPDLAQIKVKEHAKNYVYHHHRHLEKVTSFMDKPPISTNPFSAELFGHRWFEGVNWLEALFRELVNHSGQLSPISPSSYLTRYPENQQAQLVFSSWGSKGYAESWLNGETDWLYRHIHMANDRMSELVRRFPDAVGLKKRAMDQAAREILLAQTLDWPIIMQSGVATQYAIGRIREHLSNFYKIYDALGEGRLGTEWLTKMEKKNNIFPKINYLHFQSETGLGR